MRILQPGFAASLLAIAPAFLIAMGCSNGAESSDGECPTAATACGGVCTLLDSDPANCGECGQACAEGQACVSGACTCAHGEVECMGSCTDTSTDPDHCGGCGQSCDQYCSQGSCVEECPSGEDACGQSCVKFDSDPNHCGSCGNQCGLAETCRDGQCGCPQGQTACTNGCVELDSDPLNCGSCNNQCGPGQSCVAGACSGGTSGSGGSESGEGGGSGGGNNSGSGGSGNSDPIPPSVSCSTPLAERVRITTLSLPERLEDESPTSIVAEADGGARIAWTSLDRELHITTITVEDTVVKDVTVPDVYKTRGFVGHADGTSALLVRPMSDNFRLDFVKLNAGGKVLKRTNVIAGVDDINDHGQFLTDGAPAVGRMLWTGSNYVALFSHNEGKLAGSENHQADTQKYLTAEGEVIEGKGWKWGAGCSHSLDARLTESGSTIGAVCVSDSSPKPGLVYKGSESKRKVLFNNNWTELGGLVATDKGFVMNFTAILKGKKQANAALLHVSRAGDSGDPIWLDTSDKNHEYRPQLAPYGDGYLATWMVLENNTGRMRILVTDEQGKTLDGPIENSDAKSRSINNVAVFPNGDVGWAHSTGGKQLDVVRVLGCQ